MFDESVCTICGKKTIAFASQMSDGNKLCKICSMKLKKTLTDLLVSNNAYNKETFLAMVEYQNWNLENYRNIFKTTHGAGEIQFDINNGLIKLNGIIFPFSEIREFLISEYDVVYGEEKNESQEHKPLKKLLDTLSSEATNIAVNGAYLGTVKHTFIAKFWLNNFEKPLIVRYIESSEMWLYEKNYNQLINKSADYKKINRVLAIAQYSKSAPCIYNGFSDILYNLPFNGLQASLNSFGYQNISEVTLEELKSRYNNTIIMMLQYGIIDGFIANRVNTMYMIIKNEFQRMNMYVP